jgi:anti-repressor protein
VINLNLVFIENQRPVTDSLIVAQTFGKEHKHVMRDIRELECSAEFNQSNFGLTDYQDNMNRTYQKYLITQDGFSFLVMGYTGKEAARFKEMYINEFNRMRNELTTAQPSYMIGNPIQRAERWIEEQKHLQLVVKSDEEKRRIIEENRPKVIFSESVSASKSTILIGDLAKILKQNGVAIGPNRLFEWMRDNGYLIKRKGADYNAPTQRSMELGLFEIKETAITHSDGTISVNKTSKVTGKGQIYFVNKFMGPGGVSA